MRAVHSDIALKSTENFHRSLLVSSSNGKSKKKKICLLSDNKQQTERAMGVCVG